LIFATVGTQLPFPRFIAVLDDIAARHGLSVVAQTCDPSSYPHLDAHAQMRPAEFDAAVRACDVIVGHAGIGTVLSALKAAKPVVLFPRRAALGEHRNDHQLATVEALRERDGIYVAEDADTLERYLTGATLTAAQLHAVPARQRLVARLRNFIGE
jgi:UDP-N-acetylglucosamine transferase subunit ALG13